MIVFAPPPLEVHRYAAGWFWDQEIFDTVGRWLHALKRPSLRLYVESHNLARFFLTNNVATAIGEKNQVVYQGRPHHLLLCRRVSDSARPAEP